MNTCTHCNNPIVLVPSATQRAQKFGGKPSDYTKQFTMHNTCQVEKRNAETLELIRRKTAFTNNNKVKFKAK